MTEGHNCRSPSCGTPAAGIGRFSVKLSSLDRSLLLRMPMTVQYPHDSVAAPSDRPLHRPMPGMRSVASRPAARCLVALVPLLIAGCSASPTPAESQFARRIDELLADRNAVIVPASRLTDFKWNALCFERADELLLTFKGNQPAVVLHLKYEDYFVDEPYVEKSLADRCVAPGDTLLARRKYAKGSSTIEFQSAD